MNLPIRRLATGVLLCALSGAVSIRADESRIPIFRVTKISQSGHYILTQNVTGSVGPTISISAPNGDVTLDLNGFTVSHSGASSVIAVTSASHVKIRNGFITGGLHSVSSSVAGLTLSLERITAINPTSAGVEVSNAAHLEMLDSEVHAAGAPYGVHVTGASGGTITGRLEGNTINGAETCLQISEPKNWMISNNIIRECTDTGLLLWTNGTPGPGVGSNTVQDNVFAFFAQINATGVRIASIPGNSFSGNVIATPAVALWLIADDNRVFRNTFGQSPSSPCGAVVCVNGARNMIDDNTIEGLTGDCAFGFSGASAVGNAYRRNMVRIVGQAVCISGGATATDAGGNVL
jgi:hypothetical protein